MLPHHLRHRGAIKPDFKDEIVQIEYFKLKKFYIYYFAASTNSVPLSVMHNSGASVNVWFMYMLNRSFHVCVLQRDATSGFPEFVLQVTAVTPHDEEHLLYESRAVILTVDSADVLRRRAQYLSDVILSAHLPSGGEMFHFLWHRTSVILSQRREGRQVYQVGGGQDCHSASR